MAQKLFDDNIGTLTNNGSSVTINNARITLGGQQYAFDGVSENYPALSAATQYYVYAVLNSGTAELEVSTNDNDTGPTGFTDWRLVGSFITDNTPAFLAFIDSPRFLPEPSNSQKPIKFQTKTNGANLNTSGTITGLTFSNLTIGETYQVRLRGIMKCDSSHSATFVKIFHDGNELAEMRTSQVTADGGEDLRTDYTVMTDPFVATATTVTFDFTVGGSTSNGGPFYATLEELPNHVETDEWT